MQNLPFKGIKATYSDHSLSTKSGRDMSREVPTVMADQSDAVIGITDRTEAVVRGINLILAHHGAYAKILEQLKGQLHAYLDTSKDESVWFKKAKYFLCYPLAKFLRNELPPAPDGEVFRPTGALRYWMKSRLVAFNRKNCHLWYSWLQAKRCALAVSDDLVQDAYKKHYNTLTKADPGLTEEGAREIDKIFANPVFQDVLKLIGQKVSKAFNEEFDDRTPSTSACFENTRSSGGQYGGLMNIIESDLSQSLKQQSRTVTHIKVTDPLGKLVNADREDTIFQTIGELELVRMCERTIVRGNNSRSLVVSRYEYPGRHRWGKLVEVSESRLCSNPAWLNATIQAVLEPLKIRIISKGPALEYYEMKPLQKVLHTAMRDMNCFRLLGRTICPTDLLDLLPDWVHPASKWLSIDYSAATDGLSSEFGLRILDKLLIGVHPETRARAGKVLGPHQLWYPERKDGKWGKPRLEGCQSNGQLMGGILSFPILCLANLGVYLHTVRAKSSDALGRVLVNGDDMLYIGTDVDWIRHIKVARRVGLEMSVGKAYAHSAYANINSTSFVFDLKGEKNRTPWQINYLNAGLIFGQHKVQQRTAGTAESHHEFTGGIVANIQTILDGCLPGTQKEMLAHILRSRRDEVVEECKGTILERGRARTFSRNLFLPIDFGGMGVQAPVGWKYAVKKIDRRVAWTLKSRAPPLSNLPLPGFELTSEVDVIPPWIKKVPAVHPYEIRLIPGRLSSVPLGFHRNWWSHRGAVLC